MSQQADTPRTLADTITAQALDATGRGHAALAVGDIHAARAWFERALRLVPSDPSVMLALAGLRLRLGDPTALSLYRRATQIVDTVELWLGLSASALQADDLKSARAALEYLLGHHVLPAETGTIERLVAAADPDGPGWCGVTEQGDTLSWLASAKRPRVTLDGKPMATTELPAIGNRLEIFTAGKPLLGSPIELSTLRRVEGYAGTENGDIFGWAWLPYHAEAEPWITITARIAGKTLRLQATDATIAAPRSLTRPRGFHVPAASLSGMAGLLDIIGPDGRPLTGSPVDPGAVQRAAAEMARLASLECPATGKILPYSHPTDLSAPAVLTGPPAASACDPARPVCVVIPVYAGHALTVACLASVLTSIPGDTRVIVVDDATPEPKLAAHLDTLAASGRIELLRNAANQGFPAAANAGMREAFAIDPPHDVLLLNSDTLMPNGSGASWLTRLHDAAHAATDIGTVAPLSNDATILSYPRRDATNPIPDACALNRLDALARVTNGTATVEIPTSVGFCMYVKRECAEATGLFRPSLFAQGYGEENDFCIRARHLGWRHVAAPGVFVAHAGGTSFGSARAGLMQRNLAVIERLHPGYQQLIQSYTGTIPAQDALAPARRGMDEQLWTAARKPHSVILISHDSAGGVERVLRSRIVDIEAEGGRAIILRPVHDPDSAGGFMPGLCRIGLEEEPNCANLVYRLPDELPALTRLLRRQKPALFELHHRLGHHPSVMQLAKMLSLPTAFHMHDYAAYCPRVTLFGRENRYCGEPAELAACEACITDLGNRTGEKIGVAELRARSAVELASAQSVIVPSSDMARRVARHFPGIHPVPVPQENDAASPVPPPIPPGLPRRVCVIGAISIEKGYEVLLACARDAAARNLPLSFILAGHSTDDERLFGTGRVFVTGRYAENEAERLIRDQSAHVAFLPSIVPETWGFSLGLAWRAGLRACVFDIGAMAARVRTTGHGLVMPLGLPPASINQVLLTTYARTEPATSPVLQHQGRTA